MEPEFSVDEKPIRIVKYYLTASSRSRTTEVYQNRESGKLVRVYYFKSGRVEYTPISDIPQELTVRYTDSKEFIEYSDNPQPYTAPVTLRNSETAQTQPFCPKCGFRLNSSGECTNCSVGGAAC